METLTLILCVLAMTGAAVAAVWMLTKYDSRKSSVLTLPARSASKTVTLIDGVPHDTAKPLTPKTYSVKPLTGRAAATDYEANKVTLKPDGSFDVEGTEYPAANVKVKTFTYDGNEVPAAKVTSLSVNVSLPAEDVPAETVTVKKTDWDVRGLLMEVLAVLLLAAIFGGTGVFYFRQTFASDMAEKQKQSDEAMAATKAQFKKDVDAMKAEVLEASQAPKVSPAMVAAFKVSPDRKTILPPKLEAGAEWIIIHNGTSEAVKNSNADVPTFPVAAPLPKNAAIRVIVLKYGRYSSAEDVILP
jgi:hypothetical protein